MYFFITENWAKRTYIHTHKKKQNMSLASFLLRQPVGFCEQIGRTFCPFHPSLLSLSRSPSPFQLSLSVALLLSRSPCHHEKKPPKIFTKTPVLEICLSRLTMKNHEFIGWKLIRQRLMIMFDCQDWQGTVVNELMCTSVAMCSIFTTPVDSSILNFILYITKTVKY